MMDTQVTCEQGVIRVAGEMTIYRANDLKTALFSMVPPAPAAVVLDLSSVSAIDTTGLQLLLMLRRMASAGGADFSIRERSECVAEVLALTGLQQLAGQTDDIGSTTT